MACHDALECPWLFVHATGINCLLIFGKQMRPGNERVYRSPMLALTREATDQFCRSGTRQATGPVLQAEKQEDEFGSPPSNSLLWWQASWIDVSYRFRFELTDLFGFACTNMADDRAGKG